MLQLLAWAVGVIASIANNSTAVVTVTPAFLIVRVFSRPNEGVEKVPEKLNGAYMGVRSPFPRGRSWRVRDSEGSN